MSKDKAENDSQRNKNTRDSSKIREQSVDRKVSERKGLKRTDSVRNTPKETLKRTNSVVNKEKVVLKSNISNLRLKETSHKDAKFASLPSTSRSNIEISKSKLNSSRKDPQLITTSRTSFDSSHSETKRSSVSSKPNVALKSQKSRVVSEKYFPKKYPFSSHLHEGEKSPKVSKNENKNDKDVSAKKNERPKLTRERTLTKILNPDEVKVVQELVKNKEKIERPRTATIRKEKSVNNNEVINSRSENIILKQRNDSVNDSSEMTDSRNSSASTVRNVDLSDIKKSVRTQPSVDNIQIKSKIQDNLNNLQNSPKQSLKNKKEFQIASNESKYTKILRNARDSKSIHDTEILKSNAKQSKSSNIDTQNSKPTLSSEIPPSTSKQNDSEISDIDYEDDFDSYESDFEEYISKSESSSTPTDISTDTSSSETENVEIPQKRVNSAENDEEKKLDSGTYDLPELKHKQVLDEIKEAIEKENLELNKKNETTSNLASLSDEGFDEKFSLNNGFINFDLKRKLKKPKSKRGERLMNMIRLDSVSYSLFDQKAITYDEFMQSYGKTGTVQVSSQTGDDNINEEIQTEDLVYKNKWTQNPVRLPNDTQNIPYNHLGVGEDPPIVQNEQEYQPLNSKKLINFIQTSGKLMLTVVERKQNIKQDTYSNDNKIPFSEGYFKLNIEAYPFLNGRSVSYVVFSESSLLLTVHKSNTEIYMSPDEQLLSRSCICIWNLLEPMSPERILVSSGEINKACFDNKHSYLVFAGIQDGAVCIWDLRETQNYHRKIYEEKLDEKFTMCCPTYTTTAAQNTDSNSCEIIAIKCLNTDSIDNINNNQNIVSLQICTLDETGIITLWSVIERQNPTTIMTEDQGLVPWGNVVLVKGITMSVQELNPELKELQCFDLQCSDKDSNHLYVATNYGILHCLTSGMKPKPKIYSAETDATKSISCIEMCPFSSAHFLAGSEHGNVHLHCRHYERALMNLRSAEEDDSSEERVEIIQWSNSRPCVFYVKDSSNYIHVWDLLSSDMYPIYSIPFRDEITSIKLSPLQKGNHSYMAISSKRGNVYLHTINDKFGQRSSDQFTVELKTFLNYVNRL